MENNLCDLNPEHSRIYSIDYEKQNYINNPKYIKWINNVYSSFPDSEYNICYCQYDNIIFIELLTYEKAEHKCPLCSSKNSKKISSRNFIKNRFLFLFKHQSDVSSNFISLDKKNNKFCLFFIVFYFYYFGNFLFFLILPFSSFIKNIMNFYFSLISSIIHIYLFLCFLISLPSIICLCYLCKSFARFILYYSYYITVVVFIYDIIFFIIWIFLDYSSLSFSSYFLCFLFHFSSLFCLSYYFFKVKILIKRKYHTFY